MSRFLRHIFNVIVATACAVAIFSCNKTHEPEVPVGDVSFKAHSDGFEFAKGDKIAVLGAEKPFLASVEGEEVCFVGDVLQADEYYAVYPSSALKYFSPTEPVVAVVNLPTVQKAVPNEIPRQHRVSVSYASDIEKYMDFEECVSYLKFTIGPKSGSIKSISVVGRNAQPLSGDFSVMCKDALEQYPMPGAVQNACLTAQGDYLEPGDYYLAVFPIGDATVDVAFQDENGRIALDVVNVDDCMPGEVVDMGTVRNLVFESRDIIPRTNTLLYTDAVAWSVNISLMSEAEVEINVLEGADWLSVVRTKTVSSSHFRITVTENTGTIRTGRFEAVSLDNGSRVIYTVVQRGKAGDASHEVLRESLAEFYALTGGENWKNSSGWCSEMPLKNWHGLYFNEYGSLEYIGLSYNSLSGVLPETFEGLNLLPQLSLYSNSITGCIYPYIYDVVNVNLRRNMFDSITDVVDPENRIMQTLYINDNQIEGALPENLPLMPYLSLLDMSGNKFSGKVPESYGQVLARGGQLYLFGNNLCGELPESIRLNDNFRKISWPYILFQNGEGFDFTNIDIYLNYESYEQGQEPVSLQDYYSEHEYTVYVDFSDDMQLFAEVDGWYRQYHGKGLGAVGYANNLSNIRDELVSLYDPQWLLVTNLFNSLYNYPAKILLVDSDGKVVLDPTKADKDDVLSFLEEKYGTYERPTPPLPPDPGPEPPVEDPHDGLVTVLQTAEKGNGIDIVLLGDSYDAAAINDGTYEAVMREAMDYFFEIEPYKSYRSLFNVYMVNVASDNGSRLGVSYGEGTSITGNDDLCFDYAAKALTSKRLDNALVITIVNSDKFGGSTYMYTPGTEGDWAGGKAVSYIPKVSLKMDFRGLIQHEAGGHGFAKLADEYVGGKGDALPESEKESKSAYMKYGWYANVDFTDDPAAVKWAHILADPRYDAEPEGLYEGAVEYSSGVWRPTYTSIMKDNQGTFNAPSREAIWRRIHKLAYGTVWSYDYDSFAAYDAVNRRPVD